MIVVLPQIRRVFHTLCDIPAPSVFSATGATATLPQPAPHNPYSNHPINTANGCYDVSYLIRQYLGGLFFVLIRR